MYLGNRHEIGLIKKGKNKIKQLPTGAYKIKRVLNQLFEIYLSFYLIWKLLTTLQIVRLWVLSSLAQLNTKILGYRKMQILKSQAIILK